MFINVLYVNANNPQYSSIADFSKNYCNFGNNIFTYTQELYSAFAGIYGNDVIVHEVSDNLIRPAKKQIS